MARRIIRQYLFLSLLLGSSWHFALGIQNAYITSKGISEDQLHIIAVAFIVATLVAEVPTGAFADVVGRRWLVAIGSVICGLSLLYFANAQTLQDFCLANILCGIGVACSSGATQAWMVDQTRHVGYDGKHNDIYVQEDWIGRSVGALFSVIGTTASLYQENLPWLIASVFQFVGGLAALWIMQESYLEKRVKPSDTSTQTEVIRTLKEGVRYAATHSPVRFIILSGFVWGLALASPDQQYQPELPKYFANSKTLLGGVWIAILLFGGIGNSVGTLLTKRFTEEQTMRMAQIFTGVTLGVSLTVMRYWPIGGLTLYLAHEASRGTWYPVQRSAITTEVTNDQQRATINSCSSMMNGVGNFLGLCWGGIFLFLFPGASPASWFIAGSILIIGTITISRTRR